MSSENSFLKSKFYDWARDVTSLANPLVLIFVPLLVLGFTKQFYVLLIALLVNEIVGSLIKIIFPKTRPNGQKYNTLLEKIDAGSFPSLHSSRITIVYLTLFHYQDSIAIKIIILLLMLYVMISRVLLKKHFITDVIGGFVCGLLIWYVSIYLI